MLVKLKTLFLVLVMAVGTVSGAPLSLSKAFGGMDSCAMKCCKKQVKTKEDHHKDTKSFCSISACSETAPAAPGFSSQSSVAIGLTGAVALKHTTEEDLDIFDPADYLSIPVPLKTKSQPLFILHNSILV